MHSPDITVAIPTIPPRAAYLRRALASVQAQTLPAMAVSIAQDVRREGAALTRDRALAAVRTKWTAFLDDDDEFKPEHLDALAGHAAETGADYVYSHFEVIGGGDPFPGHRFLPWDNNNPRQTTITTLVRTELAQSVAFAGWSEDGQTVGGQRWGEDYSFTLGCMNAGAKISHLVEAQTWLWHHHGANTSGRPDRW